MLPVAPMNDIVRTLVHLIDVEGVQVGRHHGQHKLGGVWPHGNILGNGNHPLFIDDYAKILLHNQII